MWASISGWISEAYSWGANLVKGIWSGVSDWAGWLWGKISGFFDDIWSGIKNFFGIHSPSTKFAWIAEMDIKGLAEGFNRYGALAVSAAEAISSDVYDAMSVGAGSLMGANSMQYRNAAAATPGKSYQINMTVNAAEGMNESEFADYVIDRLQMEIIGSEATYA